MNWSALKEDNELDFPYIEKTKSVKLIPDCIKLGCKHMDENWHK